MVSLRANPLTDSLCRDGIARAAEALPLAYAHASTELANPLRRTLHTFKRVRTWRCWSWGRLPMPGWVWCTVLPAVSGGAPPWGICASLLPEVMRTNIHALRQRAPSDRALERYTEIARLITAADTTAERGADAGNVRELERSWLLHGVQCDCVPRLVASARRASSMKANPIELTDDELRALCSGRLDRARQLQMDLQVAEFPVTS